MIKTHTKDSTVIDKEMIKFETINGQLCRMLKKPVPLTTDAKTPCIVRLIQDDSPMGRYNKWNYDGLDTLKKYSIVYDAKAESDDEEKIFCYEILGYPVEEGSHWWALYHMQSGNTVCHTKAPSIKYSMPTHYVKRKVRENCTDDMSIQVWLSGADETGWQLYEPKVEPVKCEFCRGRGSYISSSATNPGYVRCPACNGTGKVDKSEPKFKVGDWVEFVDAGGRKSQCKYLSNAYDNTIFGLDITYNMRCVVPTAKIIRKLSPAEVVIDFGSFKGTIELNSHPFNKQITVKNTQGYAIAYINIEYLDTPTRELVQSLLKAQEESCQ